MNSYTPRYNKVFNLWGAQTGKFARYPKAYFNGVKPNTTTNLSYIQLRSISLPNNGEVLQLTDDNVVTGDSVPQEMDGVYDTDGLGVKKFRYITPTESHIIFSASEIDDITPWSAKTQMLDISTGNLYIPDDAIIESVLITMTLENPKMGLWFNFIEDSSVFYPFQSLIRSEQSSTDIECHTVTVPLTHDKYMNTPSGLYVKYRNDGKFNVQIRGVTYRRKV